MTDGACTEKEILEQELVMLKVLKWDLSPFTVNSWLNVYMQLVNIDSMEEKEQSFIVPQYSQHAFIQIARVSVILPESDSYCQKQKSISNNICLKTFSTLLVEFNLSFV